jgi:extracellular factor (EF) 3-hydroxypalmitic acid methyl ester biosynthesis protein
MHDYDSSRLPAAPRAFDALSYTPDPLEALRELCEAFDELLRTAARDANPDLVGIERRSRALSRAICNEIDVVRKIPSQKRALEEFRTLTFPRTVLRWVKLNSFVSTLWSKSSGCPGSHETIRALCEERPEVKSLSDVFFSHALRCSMARQHRQKVQAQAEFIVEKVMSAPSRQARILNVGCGPSLDVAIALERLGDQQALELQLIDLDGEALASSRGRLERFASDRVKISYEQADAIRALRKLTKGSADEAFDAALFGGLFDYLQDRHIHLLLKMSRTILRAQGEVFFSQVAPDNPDRTYMEWFGDWHLILRDEAHVVRLAEGAGAPRETVRVSREPSGCAILCRMQ